MTESPNKFQFLAVLLFEDGSDRYCEEPRVYLATHPEIAYQLALVDGKEQRYGRRFVGLSHLEENTSECEPISRSSKGNANDLVVKKENLSAFSDSRWREVLCDHAELAAALRGPALLFQIDGLDKIQWDELNHAYGSASDVPKDIRRLAASEPQVREQALWELSGSIYHQGTIYSATAAAVPFLLRVALHPQMLGRVEICGLLSVVAESCAFDPEKIRSTWKWRKEKLGEVFGRPTEELANEEITNMTSVRNAFRHHADMIQSICVNPDPAVAKLGCQIIKCVET